MAIRTTAMRGRLNDILRRHVGAGQPRAKYRDVFGRRHPKYFAVDTGARIDVPNPT
jgi:hypothetical protein